MKHTKAKYSQEGKEGGWADDILSLKAKQAGSSKLISEAVEEVVQLLISSKTPAPTVCMRTRPLNTMTRDDMEAVSHNVCVLPAPLARACSLHPWLAD
ncbi:unnamed protein product [Gadus morhua 'NCC']